MTVGKSRLTFINWTTFFRGLKRKLGLNYLKSFHFRRFRMSGWIFSTTLCAKWSNLLCAAALFKLPRRSTVWRGRSDAISRCFNEGSSRKFLMMGEGLKGEKIVGFLNVPMYDLAEHVQQEISLSNPFRILLSYCRSVLYPRFPISGYLSSRISKLNYMLVDVSRRPRSIESYRFRRFFRGS